MKQVFTTPLYRNPFLYIWVILSILLAYQAIYFIIDDALPYYGFEDDVFGRFMTVRWWLIGHITGGMIALVIGPFQFWESFRNRNLSLHRTLGKVYLLSIILAASCSIYMATHTALAIHWTWAVSLMALAIVWLLTIGMAYRFIRLKRVRMHREWMIRSYVVTFAFVIFRYLEDLPVIQNSGSFVEHGPTVGWLSWTVPLLITEMVLAWNKK